MQGVGGALLTPGSLAIIESSFRPSGRSRAIGAWSGLGGVAIALGPLLGAIWSVLMLALSARSGALAQRIGARIPLTVGPLVIAFGLLMLTASSLATTTCQVFCRA